MIRLGDTIEVKYGDSISRMWLIKDLNLKQKLEESGVNGKGYYKVLGLWKGHGWWSLAQGTLKQMREFIRVAKETEEMSDV